jgi:Mg2+ and Co2+ transporter CorA
MEPGDAFYGNTEADNVETPEEVAEVSQETPEETVVESEELESVASETKESAESLVYELGDREITQDQILEWEKGYLRQSDYTQKTQGIADKVKAETSKQVAEKLGDIDAKANTLVEHVNNLEAMLNEVEGNVNLDELREYD